MKSVAAWKDTFNIILVIVGTVLINSCASVEVDNSEELISSYLMNHPLPDKLIVPQKETLAPPINKKIAFGFITSQNEIRGQKAFVAAISNVIQRNYAEAIPLGIATDKVVLLDSTTKKDVERILIISEISNISYLSSHLVRSQYDFRCSLETLGGVALEEKVITGYASTRADSSIDLDKYYQMLTESLINSGRELENFLIDKRLSVFVKESSDRSPSLQVERSRRLKSIGNIRLSIRAIALVKIEEISSVSTMRTVLAEEIPKQKLEVEKWLEEILKGELERAGYKIVLTGESFDAEIVAAYSEGIGLGVATFGGPNRSSLIYFDLKLSLQHKQYGELLNTTISGAGGGSGLIIKKDLQDILHLSEAWTHKKEQQK